MDLKPLPFDSTLVHYQQQAEKLLEGQRSSDREALRVIHHNHRRFLDSKISWLPKDLPDSEILNAALDIPDHQLALARWYNFQDWPALKSTLHR